LSVDPTSLATARPTFSSFPSSFDYDVTCLR